VEAHLDEIHEVFIADAIQLSDASLLLRCSAINAWAEHLSNVNMDSKRLRNLKVAIHQVGQIGEVHNIRLDLLLVI